MPIRSTIRTDGKYLDLRDCAQPRGWDTEAILEEIGLSRTDVEALRTNSAATPG